MAPKDFFDQAMSMLTDTEIECILRAAHKAAGGDVERAVKIMRAIAREQYEVTLVQKFVRLVDETGQNIPHTAVTEPIGVYDQSCYFKRPTVFDCVQIINRLKSYFPVGTIFLSPDDFRAQIVSMMSSLRNDLQVGNLLNGVHLPVCFPMMNVGDYPSTIRIFLEAVGNAFSHLYSGMVFRNMLENELNTNFQLFESERFSRFLETMAAKPQAGLFFPDSLRAFSPNACHQQIDAYPDGFSLAGVLGTALALVAHTEILVGDNAPAMDCAAHFVKSSDDGRVLFFEPRINRLYFGGKQPIASGTSSCGILYRGTI